MSYGCLWISYAKHRSDTSKINSFYLKCFNKNTHLILCQGCLYSWGVSLTSEQPVCWDTNIQKAGCSLTTHDSTNHQLQCMHRWLIGFITVFTNLGRGTPPFPISLRVSTSSTEPIHVLRSLRSCFPTWSNKSKHLHSNLHYMLNTSD